MKKVLLPLEGSSYHRDLLEFAAALNERSRLQLTAVNHGTRVKHYCDEHSIDCLIHEDRFDRIPGIHGRAGGIDWRAGEIVDLALLSNSRFFEALRAHRSNAFMRQVLLGSDCPVLLVPEKPALPGEILLVYDGSGSSINAIHQFVALFPEFTRLRTTLVCAIEEEKRRMPKEAMIREWCEQHFRHFRACRLQRRNDGFYDAWIGMLEQPWLVTGAGHRGDWSRLFEHSFVNRLVRSHGVPMFVAHL